VPWQLSARVVVNDIDESAAAAPARDGASVIVHACNIANFSQAEGVIERCVTEYGQIDGLVNNAGILRLARIEEMTALRRRL
jgi:NAD(P)-dependent dehydrogenase (short-subunit alcohol dehydrogenase family)